MRMSTAQARQAFGQQRVARLATVGADASPHLVPVTFAVVSADAVVFAVDHKPKTTPHLQRLRNIVANPAVCLLADHYSDDWDRLWWVRADGTARLAPDDEREAAMAALTAKYQQYRANPPAGPVVWISVTTWRGWAAAEPVAEPRRSQER